MTVGSDLDGSQHRIPSGAVVLAGGGDAGPDEDSRLPSARLLLGALVPDRMLLQLVQDLRGADRHAVRVSGHDPAAGRERVAAAELEWVERERRADFVDHHFERGRRLHGSITTHRARGHSARVERIGGDVDFRDIVNADRHVGGDRRHTDRKIGEAAAIQRVVGGEADDFAGRPIDPHPGADLEGVPLDPRLKLLEAVVREPDRTIGEEHRRQRDVKRERRMVASAESAAAIGRIGVDAHWLHGRLGLAEQICDRAGDLEGRLRADDKLEGLARPIEPGKAAFRLEKHRVDRLGLEFAVQHQKRRIVRREFSPDPLAVLRSFGIGLPGRDREPRPYRLARVLEAPGTDPAVLERREHIGRLGRRAADAGEAKSAVVGRLDRAGFVTELRERRIAEHEARLIESVEVLEDQQRHGLTEIERRPADRAEQIAGIIFGDPYAGSSEIGGGYHHRRLQRSRKRGEVDTGIDMGRVRCPKHHGVRRFRRPAREIGGAKIGRIELGARDFGDAVDAAHSGRGRIPASPSRQRLAGGKSGLRGDRQARHAKRNAARHRQPDELASRGLHASHRCMVTGEPPPPGLHRYRPARPRHPS